MIQLTEKYINFNNYFPNSTDFNEYYLSHPDYPSLFAISDTLTFFGIENSVAKIEVNQYDDLPDNFLSFINTQNGEAFVYITAKEELSITFLSENNKTNILSKEQFVAQWTGIILIVDENILEEKPIEKKNHWIYIFYIFISLLLYNSLFVNFSWILGFYSFLSLMGLYLSILILREKFDLSNAITSKICTTTQTGKSSCQMVLESDGAKIYKNYSLSDLCIVFFSTLSLITTASLISTAFFIPISFLSIPIVLYSIWYQKYKITNWCPLCIGICIMLTSMALLTFFQLNIFSIKIVTIATLYFTLISLLITTIWVNVKPIIDGYFELKNRDRENRRFKLNIKTFKSLLLNSDEIEIEQLQYLKKIEIGNRKNKLELSLFFSPFCKHCYKTYEDSYRLLQQFPNELKLSVYFNVNIENEENQYTKIAAIIIETYLTKDENKIIELLNDWYINKSSLENFVKKYDLEISQQTRDIILSHFDWCTENELNYTPIIIINDNLMPNEYSIDELRYFILDLVN